MSFLRDAKKDEDEQSSYYSDCSSSSWHTSSDESSSSDESDRPRRGTRNNRLREEEQYATDSFFRLPSLMRHRRTKAGGDCEEGRGSRSFHKNGDKDKYQYEQSARSFSDDSFSSKNKKKRRRGRIKGRNVSFHWSTTLLAMSLLVWCGVQIATTDYIQSESWNSFYSQIDPHGPHHKRHNGHENNSGPRPHRPPPVGKKDSVSEKEKLKPGCEFDQRWQTPDTNSMLLACQLLHEMDLSEVLSSVSNGRRQRSLSSDAYLGSGLWRDVWKIRDNTAQTNNITKGMDNFVVLKTMKPEHDVIHRNLERHRREAATMSRLTKSPHIADIFAYCGNSILTEFAAQDLSHALKTKKKGDANGNRSEKRRTKKDTVMARRAKERNEAERKLSSKNTTSIAIDSDSSREISTSAPFSSSLSTALPLATRVDWALQASTAIAEMHRSDVIHADITTKQFLVISSPGGTHGSGNATFHNNVRIKVNDFNRCRFVPRRQQSSAKKMLTELENTAEATSVMTNETTDRCPIRIPSAPGSYRSPEEYAEKELTPQMDVYSLGHVLYEIWTNGETPWRYGGGRRFKAMVMEGALPIELQRLKDYDSQGERILSTKDADSSNEDDLLAEMERDFGRVISKCYLLDPRRRITADDLVRELTQLLDRVPKQKTM